jgi:hypothetical protein
VAQVVVAHALRRVERRCLLLEQVAAGDDLVAVRQDLAVIDGEPLPRIPPPGDRALDSYRVMHDIKGALHPTDALRAALFFEDGAHRGDVQNLLMNSEDEVRSSLERIVAIAEERGVGSLQERRRRSDDVEPAVDTLEDPVTRQLRRLGQEAVGPDVPCSRLDDALLSLVRDGDASPDLHDVYEHLAFCNACRARLTEGGVDEQRVHVVAVEQKASSREHLADLCRGTRTGILPRGNGRFALLVDGPQAPSLLQRLEEAAQRRTLRFASSGPVQLLTVPPPWAGPERPATSLEPLAVGACTAEARTWAALALQRPLPDGRAWPWVLLGSLLVTLLGLFLWMAR